MAAPRICSVDGCDKVAVARAWCMLHYKRWKKYGDPLQSGGLANGEALKHLDDLFDAETDDCVIWPHSKDKHGYGQIAMVVDGKRRPIGVHVVICEKMHGKRPSRKHQAAHSCGNGHLACCNKRHLRWATRSENEQDKTRHGRRIVHENFLRSNAKLTEAHVQEIRSLNGTVSQKKLAQMFGVRQSTISCVVLRKTWTNI